MVELLIIIVVLLLAILGFNLLLAKHPDFFYRDKPAGLCNADLPKSPNWVSSLVHMTNSHYTPPLPITPLNDIAKCIHHIDPKTYVVIHFRHIEGYRRTKYFGFTDWFCTKDDGNITSSATMGYSDLGNNRRWVDTLREQLQDYSCLEP